VTLAVLVAPIDPVKGGSCNDYDYTCGDPVNIFDIGGTQLQTDWCNINEGMSDPVPAIGPGYTTIVRFEISCTLPVHGVVNYEFQESGGFTMSRSGGLRLKWSTIDSRNYDLNLARRGDFKRITFVSIFPGEGQFRVRGTATLTSERGVVQLTSRWVYIRCRQGDCQILK
jgi:hypothetical protein